MIRYKHIKCDSNRACDVRDTGNSRPDGPKKKHNIDVAKKRLSVEDPRVRPAKFQIMQTLEYVCSRIYIYLFLNEHLPEPHFRRDTHIPQSGWLTS